MQWIYALDDSKAIVRRDHWYVGGKQNVFRKQKVNNAKQKHKKRSGWANLNDTRSLRSLGVGSCKKQKAYRDFKCKNWQFTKRKLVTEGQFGGNQIWNFYGQNWYRRRSTWPLLELILDSNCKNDIKLPLEPRKFEVKACLNGLE